MKGKCGKKIFSKEKAVQVIIKAKISGRAECRVYYCRICEGSHVTKKDHKDFRKIMEIEKLKEKFENAKNK